MDESADVAIADPVWESRFTRICQELKVSRETLVWTLLQYDFNSGARRTFSGI